MGPTSWRVWGVTGHSVLHCGVIYLVNYLLLLRWLSDLVPCLQTEITPLSVVLSINSLKFAKVRFHCIPPIWGDKLVYVQWAHPDKLLRKIAELFQKEDRNMNPRFEMVLKSLWDLSHSHQEFPVFFKCECSTLTSIHKNGLDENLVDSDFGLTVKILGHYTLCRTALHLRMFWIRKSIVYHLWYTAGLLSLKIDKTRMRRNVWSYQLSPCNMIKAQRLV